MPFPVYNEKWIDEEAREALNKYKKSLSHMEVDWCYTPILFQFCCSPSFSYYDLKTLKNKLGRK